MGEKSTGWTLLTNIKQINTHTQERDVTETPAAWQRPLLPNICAVYFGNLHRRQGHWPLTLSFCRGIITISLMYWEVLSWNLWTERYIKGPRGEHTLGVWAADPARGKSQVFTEEAWLWWSPQLRLQVFLNQATLTLRCALGLTPELNELKVL